MDVIFDDFDSEDEDDVRVRYRQDVVRIEGYVENVVPDLSDTQFQGHFRVTRQAFMGLMTILGPLLTHEDALGRPTIEPQHQLLAVLWLLATPDSYRYINTKQANLTIFASLYRKICFHRKKIKIFMPRHSNGVKHINKSILETNV